MRCLGTVIILALAQAGCEANDVARKKSEGSDPFVASSAGGIGFDTDGSFNNDLVSASIFISAGTFSQPVGSVEIGRYRAGTDAITRLNRDRVSDGASFVILGADGKTLDPASLPPATVVQLALRFSFPIHQR